MMPINISRLRRIRELQNEDEGSRDFTRWMVGFVIVVSVLMICLGFVCADTVTVEWDPIPGAEGYIIETSIDGGITWTPTDVGNCCELAQEIPSNTTALFWGIAYSRFDRSPDVPSQGIWIRVNSH